MCKFLPFLGLSSPIFRLNPPYLSGYFVKAGVNYPVKNRGKALIRVHPLISFDKGADCSAKNGRRSFDLQS